ARTSAPRSAPRPSSAIVGGGAPAPTVLPLLARRGRGLALADLVRDHLAAGVRAADRADAMGQPGTVTARALVEARRRDFVGGPALVATRARGPLLGNGHGERAMVAAARRLGERPWAATRAARRAWPSGGRFRARGR